MRKITIIVCILIIIIITGCDISNTPTSRTEELLGKYQMLDKSINTSYTLLTNDPNITLEKQKEYEELIKKQYRNLVYEIKEESIDGNNSTVTVEIEVIDYKKVLNKKPIDELNALKKAKDRITYTINFKLTKDKNGNWKINNLDEEEKLKLLGMK